MGCLVLALRMLGHVAQGIAPGTVLTLPLPRTPSGLILPRTSSLVLVLFFAFSTVVDLLGVLLRRLRCRLVELVVVELLLVELVVVESLVLVELVVVELLVSVVGLAGVCGLVGLVVVAVDHVVLVGLVVGLVVVLVVLVWAAVGICCLLF